jgi:hypothetical protein
VAKYCLGKVVGQVALPVAALAAARDVIGKRTLAFDYWWPLLEEKARIQVRLAQFMR